jgi:hypothetical protein
VVISNIPGAYDVVEDLILDLDRREAAEIPRVVRLKYADPERLSERLSYSVCPAAGAFSSCLQCTTCHRM